MRNKATQNPILATSYMRFSSLAKASIIYAVPSAASNQDPRRPFAEPRCARANLASRAERPQFTFKAQRGYSCLDGESKPEIAGAVRGGNSPLRAGTDAICAADERKPRRRPGAFSGNLSARLSGVPAPDLRRRNPRVALPYRHQP